MAEEEDPWAFDETETTTEAAPAAGGDGAPPAEGGEGQGEAPAEGGEAPAEPPKPVDPLEEERRKRQLYKHWVRPRFLQYKYMYNYRTNYYDDVIDYLDKRNIGIEREIPRAQTWAERVLRTGHSGRLSDQSRRRKEDSHLIQVLAASIKPHNYHTKSYINLKYSSML